MFEFVEETFNGVALPVKPTAEGRWIDALWHGADVSPGTALSKPFAKGVGIISPIRQEDIPRQNSVEHILSASSVVGLAFGKLQGNRQA